MKLSYKYRTAFGAWINDMRNRTFPNQRWPCVILDDRSLKDIVASIKLQAEVGFNSFTVFGLLTASSWLPDISRTISKERGRRVLKILKEAQQCGVKVLYGLGVYSWGFDKIIAHDPTVRGTNPHAMCASKSTSRRWMEKIVDFLLAEFDFDGFHLEASDQGRCNCPACRQEGNVEYYSRINAQTASYIKARWPDHILMTNMCGYRPWGETISREEWPHLQELGRHINFLVDAGHLGYFIAPEQRQEFIDLLPCAFGTSGGVWVYPPQRWNRLRWFLPYTQRTGQHLEELYAMGGRAVEYYMGPALNPGVEVNIAFGGRKLSDVGRSNRDVLLEVIDRLYSPKEAAAGEALADVFQQAEDAFFASFDPLLPLHGKPRGEIHLTSLLGISPGPPHYLKETMTPAGRAAYGRKMATLLLDLDRITDRIRDTARVRRIKACINGVLVDLAR